ncbi:carboxymuconolactone decarboxylase family protein [Edaphobacter sp. 12200R-103]|nr:carboxymuconolactone decarboxylase family protein [Edaphobacter sp. 12200R-103]
MAEYQSPEDIRFAKELIASAPAEAEAFFKLKSVTERSDGVIPAKYRELIALAVALTTQCSYCLDSHTRNAARAGASREEIAETVFMAAALRAGGAVGHGLLAMKLFDQATNRMKEDPDALERAPWE